MFGLSMQRSALFAVVRARLRPVAAQPLRTIVDFCNCGVPRGPKCNADSVAAIRTVDLFPLQTRYSSLPAYAYLLYPMRMVKSYVH